MPVLAANGPPGMVIEIYVSAGDAVSEGQVQMMLGK